MSTLKTDGMKYKVISLDKQGKNGREIEEETGIPTSTSNDFLRKESWKVWWEEVYCEDKAHHTMLCDTTEKGDIVPADARLEEAVQNWVAEQATHKLPEGNDVATDTQVYPIETSKEAKVGGTHLMIPDTQCKPNIDMTYLKVLGEYIVDKKPDVIVHIGDHADMESLSSYDKGKKSAEGKRVKLDIEASIEGMNYILKPLHHLQQQQLAEYGEVLYKPKMVLTLGNHEQRLMRHVDSNPELHGFLSYDSLRYEEFGWEVYDFLKPVVINGVSYVHFMANPMTGKPYGGTALNVLKNVGESFCMGHKQCLDVATRFLPSSGKQQWAIIAGAYYAHDEGYKGHQGNHHYRGIVVQHRVKEGSFEPMFVSMEYLLERYKDECDGID